MLFQDVHGVVPIVFIPAVFTEKDAGLQYVSPLMERNSEGLVEITAVDVFLLRFFEGAGEVAAVVKLAVIREERFDDVGPAADGFEKMSVHGGKGGVVFPHPSVVLAFCPVHSAASPDDGKSLGGSGDFFIVRFAFFEKRGLVPEIADEVAGEAHFRKHEKIRSLFLGDGDFLFNGFKIVTDLTGEYMELGGLDVEHMF